MDTTYIKLDLGCLIDSDWSAIEDYFRIDDSGIWLLEESAPQFRCLTQDERDLFMIHPERNRKFPVLPFPFTMKQFLKFADLPAIELHDFYLFADDTVDVVAIERLERMNLPAWTLANMLMYGELPKLAQLKEIQGEAASAYAAPVGAVGASGGEVTAPNWRMQIQAEAYERWLRLRASGCNPSVHSICEDLAKWCIEKDIKGGKGQNPRAGTIRNTVLGGSNWMPPCHSVEQAKKHFEQIARTAQMQAAQTKK